MPVTKAKPKGQGFKSVWKGPYEDGITQTLLSRFLTCRERARLLLVEGLKPEDGFSHRLEYGNLWHLCEEAMAMESEDGYLPEEDRWHNRLKEYCQKLCKQYPLQQEQVQHWYNVCKIQFPIYIDFWAKKKESGFRTPLAQEQVFCYPYELPSGRTVKLRGKFDAVEEWKYGGKGGHRGVYLVENKSKGDIDEQQIQRQLTFDLQTMLYLIAMRGTDWGAPVKGVRYNVIRRPLSGGKGTIRRHQPTKSNPSGESAEEFYARVAEYIQNEPEHYFMRWTVDVLPGDYEKFENQFLRPCLEQLCDWWDWYSTEGWMMPFGLITNRQHFRLPYGIWNPLLEGGSSELDEYLATGSTVGLRKVENLFPELK